MPTPHEPAAPGTSLTGASLGASDRPVRPVRPGVRDAGSCTATALPAAPRQVEGTRLDARRQRRGRAPPRGLRTARPLGFVAARDSPGGAGIAAYVFLWALTPRTTSTNPAGAPVRRSLLERRQWGVVVAVGAVLVVVGAVLLTPVLGGSVIGSVLFPLFAIAVGAIVAWSNLDDAQRSRWLGAGPRAGSGGCGWPWARA